MSPGDRFIERLVEQANEGEPKPKPRHQTPAEWTEQIKRIRRLTTAREPLYLRAVRVAVDVVFVVGLLALCAGGGWLLWCVWTMGGVE